MLKTFGDDFDCRTPSELLAKNVKTSPVHTNPRDYFPVAHSRWTDVEINYGRIYSYRKCIAQNMSSHVDACVRNAVLAKRFDCTSGNCTLDTAAKSFLRFV